MTQRWMDAHKKLFLLLCKERKQHFGFNELMQTMLFLLLLLRIMHCLSTSKSELLDQHTRDHLVWTDCHGDTMHEVCMITSYNRHSNLNKLRTWQEE